MLHFNPPYWFRNMNEYLRMGFSVFFSKYDRFIMNRVSPTSLNYDITSVINV